MIAIMYMYLVHSTFGVFGALARTALAGVLALRYQSMAIQIMGVAVTLGLVNSLDRLSPSAPLLGGMIAAAPIAMLTGRRDFGQWLHRQNLLLTPEECAPPPVLRRLDESKRHFDQE